MPTAAEKIWTNKWVEYYLYLDSAVTHAIEENMWLYKKPDYLKM